jgi:hypothetical protein
MKEFILRMEAHKGVRLANTHQNWVEEIPNISGWKTIHLIPEIFVQRLDK